MLITFTCKHYSNITLFGSVALDLLHLMGQSGTVPSALLADDVPDALVRLQQALAINPANPPEDDSTVSLAHRAWPLIELLKHAVTNHTNVMWDKA